MKLQLSVFFSLFMFLTMFAMTEVVNAKNLSSPNDTKALADEMVSHYINKEFLFAGVVLLVSIVLLNLKTLRSFWVKRSIADY